MALRLKYTADDVKARMEQAGIGMMQAKRELHDEWLRNNLTALQCRVRSKMAEPVTIALAFIDLIDLIKGEL